MVKREDYLRKSIQTIVNQIKKHSETYDNTSQELLGDFLEPFQYLGLSSDFAQALEAYENRYRYNNELGYYQTPFLWFSVDFMGILRKKLIFHEEALVFTLNILRRVFQLSGLTTLLENQENWEGLQYMCTQMIIPILHKHYHDELSIFYNLGILVNNFGLGTCNPKRLINTVTQSLEAYRGQISREVRAKTFFDLTGMLWKITFFHPAFISWVFMRLEIEDIALFSDFFKVIHPKTGFITSTSLIYCSNNGKKFSIFGRIVLPKGTIYEFINYLKQGEKKNILKITECYEIVDFKEFISYKKYQSGVGWQYSDLHSTLTEEEHIITPFNAIFSTDNWNKHWSYKWESNSLQYLIIYCKFAYRYLTYEKLVQFTGNPGLNQDHTILFQPHTELLWDMYKQKVCQVVSLPFDLIKSQFIDQYFIIPPTNVDNDVLTRIINVIPFSVLYILQNGEKRIFAHLNPELVDFLQIHLKWGIHHLIQLKRPSEFISTFLDTKLLTFRGSDYSQI